MTTPEAIVSDWEEKKAEAFEQKETVAEVAVFSKEGDPVSTSRNVVMFDPKAQPLVMKNNDTYREETDYYHRQIRFYFPDGSVQVAPIDDVQGRIWAKLVRGPKPAWCPMLVWRLFDKKFYPGVGNDSSV